jgi:transcriptional regulator with XRE-family HTH domain
MSDYNTLSRELETPGLSRAKQSPTSETASNRTPTSADHNVGRRIRHLRRSQGLTLKELAARVGVTGAQFHRYEMGSTRVAAGRLIAIAAALGVLPEQLMSEFGLDAAPHQPRSTPASIDIVELVEIFSQLNDERRRAAVLTFARSLANQT